MLFNCRNIMFMFFAFLRKWLAAFKKQHLKNDYLFSWPHLGIVRVGDTQKGGDIT